MPVAASAISGEWAATLTGRTMARLAPSPFAAAAAASTAGRAPETTTWPGELRFATPKVPWAAPAATRSSRRSSGRPMIAAIAPGWPSPEACMRRPRSRTRRIPSASEITPVATRAEYWPMEWPAAKVGTSGALPAAALCSSSARRKAIEAASSAGWALTVRSSSSAGPSQARRERGSPSASSAWAKTAAAAGETAASARPMPTACEPWPGKTKARLDIVVAVPRANGPGAAASLACSRDAGPSGTRVPEPASGAGYPVSVAPSAKRVQRCTNSGRRDSLVG